MWTEHVLILFGTHVECILEIGYFSIRRFITGSIGGASGSDYTVILVTHFVNKSGNHFDDVIASFSRICFLKPWLRIHAVWLGDTEQTQYINNNNIYAILLIKYTVC